jgi:hypothetical protein
MGSGEADDTSWMATQERVPIAPAHGEFLWMVNCNCCDLGYIDKDRATAWNLYLDHYGRVHRVADQ